MLANSQQTTYLFGKWEPMKFIKRTMLVIVVIAITSILFRGWLYRHLITYRSVGHRSTYLVTNYALASFIDTQTAKQQAPDIMDIIKIGLSVTSRRLNFTAAKNDNDPNRLITSKTAHCVGYAAFFATTCNYLLQKNGLAGYWRAKPQVGQIYFIGMNINKWFNTPFFKDHDFVTIENKVTGETFAVDPTVNDYLFIDFVTYKR